MQITYVGKSSCLHIYPDGHQTGSSAQEKKLELLWTGPHLISQQSYKHTSGTEMVMRDTKNETKPTIYLCENPFCIHVLNAVWIMSVTSVSRKYSRTKNNTEKEEMDDWSYETASVQELNRLGLMNWITDKTGVL